MTFEEWFYEQFDRPREAAVVNSKLTPDHIADVRKLIPEGYALVPIEPTEAMFKAGNELCDHTCDVIYEAMIQAALEQE